MKNNSVKIPNHSTISLTLSKQLVDVVLNGGPSLLPTLIYVVHLGVWILKVKDPNLLIIMEFKEGVIFNLCHRLK